jgi:hypothetical protein
MREPSSLSDGTRKRRHRLVPYLAVAASAQAAAPDRQTASMWNRFQ